MCSFDGIVLSRIPALHWWQESDFLIFLNPTQVLWYHGMAQYNPTVNGTLRGKLTMLTVHLFVLVLLCSLTFSMAQVELSLPELIVEDFQCGWTRFEFIAAAKEWNTNKQLAVIPTLLRGRLIDYYHILLVNSHSLYSSHPQIIASGYTTNAVINAALR